MRKIVLLDGKMQDFKPYRLNNVRDDYLMNYQNIPQQISYTPAQVAKMLGVKTSTVHAWLSRNEMRGSKVGHSRFITPQQINEFHSRRNGGKNGDYINYTYAPR